MKKKVLNILSIMAISLSVGITFNNRTKVNDNDFNEYAFDIHNEENGFALSRGLHIGDGTTDISQTFVQYGQIIENNETYYCMRFATAIKGNIESLEYVRAQVGTKLEETKEVTTVYRGLKAEESTYYYTGDPTVNNGLSTDSEYMGKYYWACYTIKYSTENLVNYDVKMTLNVDGEMRNTRTSSLSELLYGEHEHDNNHYYMTNYFVGDTFLLDEFKVYQQCLVCGGGYVDINYTNVNVIDKTVLQFNDELEVSLDNGIKLTNPVSLRLEAEDATLIPLSTSKMGLKDKSNWMTNTCSGETFVASANVGDELEFTFNSSSNNQLPLVLGGASTAINSGLTNLTETPISSVLTAYVNDQEIEIPSDAVFEGKTSPSSDSTLWVNWTRAYLGNINVVEGTNTIKFVFKNDKGLSNQYDKNAIGSYDYIELNAPVEHNSIVTYDNTDHWEVCSCKFTTEKVAHTLSYVAVFSKEDYKVGSTISASDISLKSLCDCGYENVVASGFELNIPEGKLKVGDIATIKYGDITIKQTIPVYELNIQHVPVKQDYEAGEKLDLTGLILDKKFSTYNKDYENFSLDDVVYEDKILTVEDTYVVLNYDGLTVNLPINVKEGVTKIELENLEFVTVESGKKTTGENVSPKPKSGVEYKNGAWTYGSQSYDSYEAAYSVGYSKLSDAGKTQVENASGKDFLAQLDGTGCAFTVNLGSVESSSYNLYLRGASNYCTSISSWTPKKVGELPLHEIMVLEVNGMKVDFKEATMPGIGDGSTASHAYWTNWYTLDLGEIELDPTLDNNTLRFYFTEENALNEKGVYKYLYYPSSSSAYAFGQYDYMMIEPISNK